MRWFTGAVLIAALAGCAQPRVITSITGAEGQMKFIYSQSASFFQKGETGLLQCSVNPDGTLTGCRSIPITFAE
jgi:hypothetical protein